MHKATCHANTREGKSRMQNVVHSPVIFFQDLFFKDPAKNSNSFKHIVRQNGRESGQVHLLFMLVAALAPAMVCKTEPIK